MFDKFKELLQFLCIMYRNIQIVSGPDVDHAKGGKTTKLISGDVSANQSVSVSPGCVCAEVIKPSEYCVQKQECSFKSIYS